MCPSSLTAHRTQFKMLHPVYNIPFFLLQPEILVNQTPKFMVWVRLHIPLLSYINSLLCFSISHFFNAHNSKLVTWSYLPNPSVQAGYDTRSIFKRSLTGLNSEFSFSYTSCLTKAEEPSLSYYLPIAGGRIIGFIPFPKVLVLCEMQSASFRIWTRVAMSISYDDNHYTIGTSKLVTWLFPSPFLIK